MSDVKEFQSFVVRTENIAKELISTASTNNIKASMLDFNLIGIQTFFSEGEGKEEEELLGDELDRLNDEAIMSDKNVHIRQMYEIEITEIDKESQFSKFVLNIGANPTMSKLFATIKVGSVLEYTTELKDDLKQFINKRKLRANMLIGIWDKNLEAEIEKIVDRVQVAGTLKFEEKVSFEVGQALTPIVTVDDKLILHYEHMEEEDDLSKVDYSKRGFIQGVIENDLLIEYIKPKKGEPGRNCRGEYIEPTEPVVSNVPAFTVTDKINVIENDDSIEYRSKNAGYIVFENNVYDIKVEVEVTEISFKTTGSIEAGLDSDVTINVKESDAFKDAIGPGMEVESNEINVDGNVGNSAKLKARKINIGGQTHQSSYLEGDEVEVKIHKGMIKGGIVKVDRLEQGVIEADKVEVLQATGGKIVAKEVYIETLSSHVDIIASVKIEIKTFKGSENTFTITPVLYEDQKESLSENEDEITIEKRKIRQIKEELTGYINTLNENADSIADLKKRLANYKKMGAKLPSSFVAKFKDFQELQKKVLAQKQELKQNEDKLELLLANTKRVQEDILQAKIINHDVYQGHNEIRFKIIEPELELYHVPHGGQNEKCFMLKRDDETDEYSIEGSDDI